MRIARKTSTKLVSNTTISQQPIFAGMSARDITKSMVRVKSSNIWSYGINIRDTSDKTGDLYIQFKNNYGGAGDIYVFYGVPIVIYRKLITAPSKGHFFWQYIRGKYTFAKLTGDKQTKLKGGVNSL